MNKEHNGILKFTSVDLTRKSDEVKFYLSQNYYNKIDVESDLSIQQLADT